MVRRPVVRMAANANTTTRLNTRDEKPTVNGSSTRRPAFGILTMRASLLYGMGSLIHHQFQQGGSFLLIPIHKARPQKRAKVEIRFCLKTALPAVGETA